LHPSHAYEGHETSRRRPQHFPLRSADGACLGSGDIHTVGAGESIDGYAKSPAPPPGVRRVSLHVPSFPSFDDVRIDP
jgi:hypothetical protein